MSEKSTSYECRSSETKTGMKNAEFPIKKGQWRDPMQTTWERHAKTPVQREVGMVIKKAYCGFERLEKEHEARIRTLLENLRSGRLGARAA